MQVVWNIVQFMITRINEWNCWFLGGINNPLRTLAVLAAAGEISGIMCAYVDQKLSREFWIKVIYKVLLIYIIIGVTNTLDIWIFYEEKVLRSAATFFYISKEGVFLIENAEHLGVPIPGPLEQAIKRLQNYKENDNNQAHTSNSLV